MDNKNLNHEDLPENLQKALLEIVQKTEQEDAYIRKQQIRLWKKYERFWHGIQYIWWSETQQDWLSPIDARFDNNNDDNREGADGPFYDYVVNIYKAHGESIIAALAAQIPAVRFPPDDADNEDDLITSKTYSKIADLIQRHNQSKLMLLSALLCLWNQGIVAAYHAPKADKAFGNIKIPNYQTSKTCESCGYQSQDPENEDSCPNCPPMTDPASGEQMASPLKEDIFVSSYTDAPKTRVLIDFYGPLFVRVPYFARSQKDFGYLHLDMDQPIALLKFIYPHVADKIDNTNASADTYERVARSPSSFAYSVNDQTYQATLKRIWLRTWEFELLGDSQAAEKAELYKLFPDGAYVCFIGDVYVESRNEDMDKYWTIGKGGLSTYIHSDPLGQPLVPLQEMRNVTVNLALETIEQGISTVYADPEVLDFEGYSKQEVRPGMTVPAKAKPGTKLGDSFYEGPKATLSKDVTVFEKQTDSDAQFVVGSFPSIYGGPTEASSRTASEYNMSRQMALQRLSITWTFLTHWWAQLISKSVRLYVENVVADERYVVKENNNFVNVWIRQSELRGKVGEVEPEGAETFPITTAQKQTLLMELLQLNNEWVNNALFDPENRKIIADALAFPELHIPDENQRIKQARETQVMIGSPDQPGQFVPIEPDVDDDNTHILTLKNFLVSENGLDLKVTNPEAYLWNVQHLQMHIQHLMSTQMPAAPAPQGPPGAKINPPKVGAPPAPPAPPAPKELKMYRSVNVTLPVTPTAQTVWQLLVTAGVTDSLGNSLYTTGPNSGKKNDGYFPGIVQQLTITVNTGTITISDNSGDSGSGVSYTAGSSMTWRSDRNTILLADRVLLGGVGSETATIDFGGFVRLFGIPEKLYSPDVDGPGDLSADFALLEAEDVPEESNEEDTPKKVAPEKKVSEVPESNDEENSEDEEVVEIPEEEETSEETEEEEGRELLPHERPTVKQITEKFPDFFKKFPTLKDAFFREKQFSEVFHTPQEAKEAAVIAGDYKTLQDDLVNGTGEKLLPALKESDSLGRFSKSFLSNLYKVDKELHWQAVLPVLEDSVRIMYRQGVKTGNEDLKNSALHAAECLLGDTEVATGKKTLVEKEEQRDTKVSKEREDWEREKYNNFNISVNELVHNDLVKIIDSGLNDSNLTKFMKDSIRKEVIAKTVQIVRADKAHMNYINRLWEDAKSNGYRDADKSRIFNASLARAKSIIPKLRRELIAEAIGSTPSEQQRRQKVVETQQSRREPGNNGKVSSINSRPPSARQIDWKKTSDLDLINDKISLKKR